MRLRYGRAHTGPVRQRLATARWVEDVLPQEGAIEPVATVLTTDGVIVVLHVRAPGRQQAVAAATDVVEVVVGDARRVLGRLLGTRAVQGRPRHDER